MDRIGDKRARLMPCEASAEVGEPLGAEEEAEPRKVLPIPILLTKSERDDHNIDHIPYRSWCDACVEGRGRERAHCQRSDEERRIAVIAQIFASLDVSSSKSYVFMDFRTQACNCFAILVGRCSDNPLSSYTSLCVPSSRCTNENGIRDGRVGMLTCVRARWSVC